MIAPFGSVSDAQARVLLAVIRLHQRDGRATVRGIAKETGRALSTVHPALVRLRNRGLVTDGEHGTLRPLVWPVAS